MDLGSHFMMIFLEMKFLEMKFLIKATQSFKAVDRELMAESFVQTPSSEDYTQTGPYKRKLTN